MLLDISEASLLAWHPLQGSLFENFVIVELLKRHLNRGLWPRFYFWRDGNGVEVDCLIEREGKVLSIEIKSTQTLTSFPTSNLKKLTTLMGDNVVKPYIVYGGEQNFNDQGIQVLSWKNWVHLCNLPLSYLINHIEATMGKGKYPTEWRASKSGMG